jgi:hypothetical protein
MGNSSCVPSRNLPTTSLSWLRILRHGDFIYNAECQVCPLACCIVLQSPPFKRGTNNMLQNSFHNADILTPLRCSIQALASVRGSPSTSFCSWTSLTLCKHVSIRLQCDFTVHTFYRPLLLGRALPSSFDAVWISAIAIEQKQPSYIHPETLQSILFLLVYHLEVGSICFLQLLECSHLPRIICR